MAFLTSPGLDSRKNMEKAVRELGLEEPFVHAMDIDGKLWPLLGVRFRGTWVMVNQDGAVYRSVAHISRDELLQRLDELVSG